MDPPFSRTLYDLLREQAGKREAHPAVISSGIAVSYAELVDRASRVAAALVRDGVRRGDRVGLLISNRVEWLELFFGASAIGVTVVPFSTWSTREELAFLLADSKVQILFGLPSFGDRDFLSDLVALRGSRDVTTLTKMVIIADEVPQGFVPYSRFLGGENVGGFALPPGASASAIDDALILYTSGSSSHPKAVRLLHYGIIENSFNIGERQGLNAEDRVLLSSPLFWAYGGANAMPATLTHGATLVLQEKFDPAEAIELIERHRCTAIYTLPAMTSAMLLHPSFSPERTASLRTGVSIGSPQDIIDAATTLGAAEICNIYGATETYGNCCVTWHYSPLERRAHCQGEPLPGVEIRFVDPETGALVKEGDVGLAEVRGYVTPGYAGASTSQNEAVLTADGFYRTGDMGLLDEGGAFVFVGRNTDMIKKAGINISPAEVEDVLLRHPSVFQTCVVGVPDVRRGEIVVAFVVPATPVSVDDLTAFCRATASKYKVPDRIELCEALPLTATGKVMRRVLKDDAVALIERAR